MITTKKTMTPLDPRLVETISRLVDYLQPERIYLFGSAARGDAGPDSDYDLMVLVSDEVAKDRERLRRIYARLWGTGLAVDVVVWSMREFERRLHVNASLPATVAREGRVLYAA